MIAYLHLIHKFTLERYMGWTQVDYRNLYGPNGIGIVQVTLSYRQNIRLCILMYAWKSDLFLWTILLLSDAKVVH